MKQLAGKPFALLGVHGFDYPSAKLKAVMEVETSTPDALRGMVERDIDRYGRLVREVGMKAE